MKRIIRMLALLSIGTVAIRASAFREDAAEIQLVRVHRAANQVKIELTLSEGVVPNITRTTGPDRLIMELPQTTTVAGQHSMDVNYGSVERVRVGLHQASPPVARIVVDLNSAGPYTLMVEGNTIALTVLPAGSAAKSEASPRPAAHPWFKVRSSRSNRDATAPDTERSAAARQVTTSALVVTPNLGQKARTSFRIKYVAEGLAYLGGGGNAGLTVGMKLTVWEGEAPEENAKSSVAELRIVSIAANSALAEVGPIARAVKAGDWAFLSLEDSARLQRESSLQDRSRVRSSSVLPSDEKKNSDNRSGHAWDQDRMRGRIALDYSGISSHGSTPGSSGEIGLSFRSDMTNIAGTHWSLQGYWRGRLTQDSQPLEQTMQDYLDRTYTLQLYYDNSESKWLAGVGRLYLPWAVSLDTVDGGYLGRRIARGVIAGGFAGSTPDPASWHYNPGQRIAGSFINFEGGSYDRLHYSSTSGFALSTLHWRLDRPFAFFENELSYGKLFSAYHSLIVDSPQGLTTDGIKPGAGVSRSYLTFHIQLHPRISVDIYHNYFRDVPTAATQLIGTGVVDKLLYQGLNVGLRVEPIRNITLYTTLGRSSKTGDVRGSLNQVYGVTWSDIAHSGFRADIRYSKFDSSFARGDYRLISLSHQLGNQMLWNAQIGTQSLNSSFTENRGSFFFDTSLDTNLGRHTFIQSGYTIERGMALTYDQWYVSLGYRFDVREKTKQESDPSAPARKE